MIDDRETVEPPPVIWLCQQVPWRIILPKATGPCQQTVPMKLGTDIAYDRASRTRQLPNGPFAASQLHQSGRRSSAQRDRQGDRIGRGRNGLLAYRAKRRCQTDENGSLVGQDGRPLCHAKLTPLSESGGAVELEILS